VAGLKWFDGVNSLNERGNFRRGGAGRFETGFIQPIYSHFGMKQNGKNRVYVYEGQKGLIERLKKG
jgi:hypothetical protein